ncbi:MAG: S-layer homology domain-containing protein [Candidatus Aquicultor sp.]|nr:S-layer homology domain-containing protein [Candidatus Aquicultor sp.]
MKRAVKKGYVWFRASIVFLLIASLLAGAVPPIMPASKAEAKTVAEEFAICTAPSDKREPQIAGNYVVWEDYRSGNADIYGAKLTEVPDGPSAPKVTATSPQNGAVGVLPSSDIFAYFNLPMDKKTINQSTVLVSDGTRNIKGDISYRDWTFNDNTVQHILIFHPQEPLPRGQRYTVKLTSDIRTAEEMPRNLTPYTFSFTVDGTTRDQIIDEINSLEKTLYRKVNSTQADVALSYMTVKDTIALREAINGFEMFNEVSAMLVGDIGMDTIVNPDIINNLNNYQKSMAFYAKAISCSKFIVDAKDIDISSQILVSAINNTSRILANISYGEAEYLEGSHAIYGPNVLFNGTDELKTYISVRMFALKESIPQELPANYPADELLKELKSINTALGSSIVRSDQAVVWPYLRNGRKDYQRYAFGGTNDAYSSVLRLAGEIRKGDLRKLSNWSVVKPYAEEATKIVATYFTGGAGYFGIDALFLVAGALSSANEAIETHYTLEKTEGMIKDAYSSLIIFNGEMGAVANLISDLNKYGDYLGGLPKPLSLSVAPASANLAAASLSLASVRVDSLELNDIATEEGMIGGKGVAKIKLANEGISPAKVRVYSKVYPAYSSREIGPLSMLSSALVEVAPQTSAEATVSVSLPKSALFSPAGYIAVFFAEVQEQEGSFPETIGPFTKHFYVGSSSELSVFSSNIKNPLAVGKSIALGESTTETFTASNLAEDVYFILTQPQDADIDLHLFDEEGNHTGINYSSEETETAVPFSTYSGRRGEVEFIRVSGAAGKTFGVSIRGTEVPEGTTFDLYAIEVPKTEALMVTYPLDITVPISDAIDIPIEVKEAGTHASLEDVSLSATDAISPSGSIPASAITFDKNAVAITAGGSETFDMNIVLQEGTVDDTYTADVLIQGKDALSNKVLSSTVKLTLLVDRTAPGAPVLNTPESYTKELPITISGEAEPYSTIMIYSGDERIAMAIALPDGSFSQSVFRLKEGTNEITAIAEDAAGNKSEPSAPVSVFYSLPPATPTNFVATAGDGKVNLSWNPSIGLSIGYNLYRSTSPVLIGDKINTAAITLTSYTDTGLVNGATYYYRVQAVDMFDNESQLSEAVPATPTASSGGGSGGGGGGGSTPPAPTKPAPPTGLKANTNDNMVHLVWNPSKAEDIAGYKVYRKDKASGKVEPLNTTPIKEVQYQDKDANENTVYIYWVTAVDKKGTESEKSNEVEAIRAKKKAAVMFLDIAANAWYKSFVDQLIERNIIGGYPDGTFKPDKTITRAEFAKMVCLAQGWELINPATPSFKDIPKTNWAYSYIETAKKNGALGGYKDGTFKADKNISRAEIAKIVSGALKLSEGRSTLKDVNAHWAKGYIGACANAGIVSGYSDGTFKPNAIAKRSEASKMVAGMINE